MHYGACDVHRSKRYDKNGIRGGKGRRKYALARPLKATSCDIVSPQHEVRVHIVSHTTAIKNDHKEGSPVLQ